MAVLSLKRDRNGAYRRVGHAIPLTTRANAAIFALELVDAGHSRGRASYASVQRFTLTYEHARNGLRDELADLALLALEPLPPSGPGRAQGTRVDAFLTTMCHRYPLLDLLEYPRATLSFKTSPSSLRGRWGTRMGSIQIPWSTC